MFTIGQPIPINAIPCTIVLCGRTRYQTPINASGNDIQIKDVVFEIPIHTFALQLEQRWLRIELPTFHGSTRASQTGQRLRKLLVMYFCSPNPKTGVLGETYGFSSGIIQCTNVTHQRAGAMRLTSKPTHPPAPLHAIVIRCVWATGREVQQTNRSTGYPRRLRAQ